MVVVPVKVLSPRSVSVPAPFLTRLPLQLMTPEKLWRASVSVRVTLPNRIRPSSSQEMDSMVGSLPSRSRVDGAPPPYSKDTKEDGRGGGRERVGECG